MFQLLRIIPVLLLTCSLSQAFESRSWTDSQGRSIEATLIRTDNANVILKLKDGREIPFPLTKLSEADNKYVETSRDLPSPPETKFEDSATAPNFDTAWPEMVKFTDDPEIVTVEENPATKHFVYESANYRYVCNVRLAKSVVKGFAVMFEATYLYCRSVPLGLCGGEKTDGKLQILLFETTEEYRSVGGPASTAGVFMSGKKAVLVPLTSLGVRPVGSGYMLDREKSSKTLPHELTHQLTPSSYFTKGMNGWFTEGIAEYIGNTPYRSGTYTVRGSRRTLVEYVTGYGAKNMGGRALGKKIKLGSLESFMFQDYSSFTGNPQTSYGCGLLLTIYFIHMDGAGDGARLKNCLKALTAGKSPSEANACLLDGRAYQDLEKEITKAWGKYNVDLTFGK